MGGKKTSEIYRANQGQAYLGSGARLILSANKSIRTNSKLVIE